VEPDRQGVRREHAMVRGRKSSEQTTELETASFVWPRLQQETEPWIASRKTMARRSPGADAPLDEIEDRTR
jgi:hypothetical protein